MYFKLSGTGKYFNSVQQSLRGCCSDTSRWESRFSVCGAVASLGSPCVAVIDGPVMVVPVTLSHHTEGQSRGHSYRLLAGLQRLGTTEASVSGRTLSLISRRVQINFFLFTALGAAQEHEKIKKKR